MKRTGLLWGIFLLILAGFVIACGSEPATEPFAPEVSKNVITEEEKAGWSEQSIGLRKAEQIQWERVLREAQKEGKLTVFGTIGPPVRESLAKGFKKFSGIEIDFVTGRGGEISTKVLDERRAGLFTGDVYLGGGQTMITVLKPVFSPLKPHLVLPEVLDTSRWFLNKLHWIDKEEKYINLSAGTEGAVGDILINTEVIKRNEITSYYDLLKPEWKGKIVIQDPTVPGKGSTWFYAMLTWYGIGPDFMKRLVQQEPVLTRDNRALTEWVARGKYPVSIAHDLTLTSEFTKVGAPLQTIRLKEHRGGMVSQHSAMITLVDKAPHPAAAKVFINWFLTREGQWTFARAYPSQSFRLDVLTDHLLPEEIRQTAPEYEIQNEENILERAKYMEIAREIFSPLLK